MKQPGKIHIIFQLFGGCLLAAIAISLFLRPANIFSGGIPGIAIIILHILGRNFHQYLGLIMFCLQILFLTVQLIFGGRSRLFKGIITAFIMSSLVQTITWFTLDVTISENSLFMAVAGSILLGTGIGLVLNTRFNFAGTVGIADMISQKTGISPGRIIFFIEAGILLFGTFVIGLEKALLSTIGIFVMGRTVNFIVLRAKIFS